MTKYKFSDIKSHLCLSHSKKERLPERKKKGGGEGGEEGAKKKGRKVRREDEKAFFICSNFKTLKIVR